MTIPGLLLFLAAAPFWEVRPPAEWTNIELKSMLADSPWVQTAGPAPVVVVMLATSRPIQEAEAELVRRGLSNPATGVRPGQPPDIDYLDYLKAHREESFVLAIPYNDLSGLGRADDEKRMEAECVMRIGRRKVKIVGHFPPTPSDPVLRLIFPRVVTPTDKTVSFDLFLPGVSQPARMVEFRVKELLYRGKLEM